MATDINLDQPLFRATPAWMHPYIKLARLDRPIGTWLLLFPCWWAIVLSQGGIFHMGLHAWVMAALCVPGAVLMRGAGCVVNDLWDRKLDAKVERTQSRPLASGEAGVFGALVFLFLLLTASLGILLLMPMTAIVLGFMALVPVAIYPAMKRVTWWPQLFLGFTFNWGALLGWAAATGSIGMGGLLLYAGGIFWTLGYDTIYAHQDKDDDALVGVRSTARLFGDRSRWYVALFYAAALALTLLSKIAFGWHALTPWLALLPLLHLIWQVTTWKMDDAASSLKIFRSNRIYGWLVLALLAL